MSPLIAILAAGESKRMGQPKLCLPWGSTTILGHILAQWCDTGAEKFLVIHAPGENPVTRELDRLDFPASQRAATLAMDRGMMGSVVTAATLAQKDTSLSHMIIVLGDQPQLQTETLRRILHACATSPGKLIRLIYHGKPGHPLALPAHVLAELSATPCETLRDFLRLKDMPGCDLTIDDSGVLLDLDTPEDYARASGAAD
jgi:molybdenum cofactor cytidylyltransferase